MLTLRNPSIADLQSKSIWYRDLRHEVVKQNSLSFFFCLGFLSRIFTIHRTAAEGGGYLFISFLPLPLAIAAESSPLREQHKTWFSGRRPDFCFFFYNNESRPHTTVVGLSSENIVSLSVQDLKQQTSTRKHLDFSCQNGKYRSKTWKSVIASE